MRNLIILFFFLCFSMTTEIEEEMYPEPEHYSWDMKPIDPYENTEIIVDPYSQSDQSPSGSGQQPSYYWPEEREPSERKVW
jgi:hypothetical protein